MAGLSHHRCYTANHTWNFDLAGHHLFLKITRAHDEAAAERRGNQAVREHYPAPRLLGVRRIGPWTALIAERWPHLGTDHGLLLDVISHAELTGDHTELDDCLTELIDHYRAVITRTIARVPLEDTVVKLYGERVAPGGRLDQYYAADTAWQLATPDSALRPTNLARTRLVVNGRHRHIALAELTRHLRAQLAGPVREWAAITQGDPTDLNIGWTRQGGPMWFDHDTGGRNALPGEFACFLAYQWLHGAWLTPRYNPTAFRDHPAALNPATLPVPDVHVRWDDQDLLIDHDHRPLSARRHVMRRYLTELVEPLAAELGIDDLVGWLRPYLIMRLLAVFDLTTLAPSDCALSVALVAQTLDPTATLPELLGLIPSVHRAQP